MVNFKEYLEQKTLNEDTDEEKVFKKYIGNIKNIEDYDPSKNINSNTINDLVSTLNDIAKKMFNNENLNMFKKEDKDKIEKGLNNALKKKEKEDIRKNGIGDIPSASAFYKALSDESALKSLSHLDNYQVKQIVNCILRNNTDKDRFIDKEEFVNGIIEIKKEFEGRENIPATALWILYLRQIALKSGDKIFKKTDGTLDLTIAASNLADTKFVVVNDKNNKTINTDEFKFIQDLFDAVKDKNIELEPLKKFNTIGNGTRFLKQSEDDIRKIIDDESKKENSGYVTEAGQKIKLKDNSIKNTEENLTNINQELKEINEKHGSNGNKETDDFFKEAFKRKNFFIFDIILPESFDEIQEFKDKMQSKDFVSGPIWFIEQIKEKIKSYEITKKKNDLIDNDEKTTSESIINKCLRKNGYKVIKENYEEDYSKQKDTFIKKLDEYEKKAIEIIGSADSKRKSFLGLKFGKDEGLISLQNKNANEEKYSKVTKNETKMRQLLIPVGEKLTELMLKIREEFEPILFKMKMKNFEEKVNRKKTMSQVGQDNLDVKKLTNLINNSNYNDDAVAIARFFLINVLRDKTDSEEIKKILLSENFGALHNYIYSGTSGKVFALNAKDVNAKKLYSTNYIAYNFTYNKVKVFKNPRDLLNYSNINIDNFINNIDVLKGLRNNLKNDTSSKLYIDSSKELINIMPKKGNSVQTEEEEEEVSADETLKQQFNQSIEQKKNEQSFVNNTKTKLSEFYDKFLNTYCEEIKLPSKYGATQNGPEDIALRQILKGFVLITNGSKSYITSQENYKIIQDRISKEIDTNTSSLEDIYSNESGKTEGQVNDSVVTSGAADSTYGDGYGYNKKADAIKKKLNCTTYTYSPNSKMKIVRRTFD